MSEQRWVCRHGHTSTEDCGDCDNDDTDYNRYPNGWHYEEASHA